MPTPSFQSSVTVTHIGTATAIIEIDDLALLTDPYFSPVGTTWDRGYVVLESKYQPPLGLADLPPIDAVLLSHEDHPDNLDTLGRQLLNGRRVFTTVDGAKNLSPRSGVVGLEPWETVTLKAHGKQYNITGMPCLHTPPSQCIGFVVTAPHFGETDGLPNALYFSGDTVYIEELVRIRREYHVSVALLNLGKAVVALGGAPKQITMDGRQGARLIKDIGAEIVIPMHFESWTHFTEGRDALEGLFEEEGVADRIRWLAPGVAEKIL